MVLKVERLLRYSDDVNGNLDLNAVDAGGRTVFAHLARFSICTLPKGS